MKDEIEVAIAAVVGGVALLIGLVVLHAVGKIDDDPFAGSRIKTDVEVVGPQHCRPGVGDPTDTLGCMRGKE